MGPSTSGPNVFAEDGSHIELLPLVKALLEGNMRRTIEQIDLQNIAEDMNAFAKSMEEYGSRKDVQEAMAGYMDMVDGGYREIFRLIE